MMSVLSHAVCTGRDQLCVMHTLCGAARKTMMSLLSHAVCMGNDQLCVVHTSCGAAQKTMRPHTACTGRGLVCVVLHIKNVCSCTVCA